MNILHFNNSGLRDMACSRKYSLIHTHGLRFIRNDAMLIGSAFHHYMQVFEPGDSVATLRLFPHKHPSSKLLSALSDVHLTRLADLACRASALLPQQPHIKEHFFSFDSTDLLQPLFTPPTPLQVLTTGTIDRAEVMDLPFAGPTLVLTDYKTTHKKLSDGDFHLDYQLQSQFPFYATALIHAQSRGALPPAYQPFASLIAEQKLAKRYLFCNYTDKAAENPGRDDLFLQPPSLITREELQQFSDLFDQRRALAAFIHTSPSLAQKDGILNGTCYGCPFRQICALNNNDKEAQAIADWSLGRAAYDPTHQAEDI